MAFKKPLKTPLKSLQKVFKKLWPDQGDESSGEDEAGHEFWQTTKQKKTKSLGLLQLSYAPLFERRSGSGGHLEDLGAILDVLAPMASTI